MTMESAAGMFAAIVLPWLCGYGIIRLLLGKRLPFTLYAGHGYLVGLYLVILLLQLWNVAGWPLRFWPLAAVLAVITIPALWKLYRGDSLVPLAAKSLPRMPGWKYMVTTLLVALIFIHLLVVLQELWLRPTFPWDAWRGWAPKAIQFFDNRALSFEMGTIANYGIISPQIHLWAMLASGTTLEPTLYLPWYFALVALAMAVYGHLRLHCSTVPSLLGAYLVASLPYLNIHTSLAGYADLWLTLAFTLGLMTISLYRHQKRTAIVVLALLYAVISIQAKRAGLGMGLIVLLCLAMAESRWSKVWVMVLMVFTSIIAGLIYAALNDIVSIRIDIPSIGTLILDSDQIRVPMVGAMT
ncbi:hypothetical protein [Kineobactrum salinum]|uniref:Glycosyltransferase RgtA/B/C/D-like domain-containing protein n=1 Tax=Kineobactrum salinum TaxID=2708301 RepID=A0A6C0U228_9GAMM|nr:hypothetical protein [Kineobactrum salinum]QIB65978.1 hypothetical protein G3T16_11660 [Kineobactrum salinum]